MTKRGKSKCSDLQSACARYPDDCDPGRRWSLGVASPWNTCCCRRWRKMVYSIRDVS